jgi:hypothetical protein
MLAALISLSLASDDLATLTKRTYAEFGRAAERIPFEGETLDRLTILGRLASESDPVLRKRLFDALAPVRATIADAYPDLVRLRRASWTTPPFEQAAARWGIAPEKLEAWLVSVLETWRDAQPTGDIEPWDLAWSWGDADRTLADALPRDRMIKAATTYLADMGARVDDLSIELDLAPRPGKDPVAFTDFVVKPRRSGGTWSGGRYRVSASYREGGLGNLYELVHELGHGLHQYLSRPVGYLQCDTPLTTAETASVFGEMLTFQRLLQIYTDPRTRLAMLCSKIEDGFATAFRQVVLTRFEQKLHQARREKGELTTENINELWLDVGIRLRLGMGCFSLWSLALRSLLWLDVDPRYHVGARMGCVGTIKWLLWLGTIGPWYFNQYGDE